MMRKTTIDGLAVRSSSARQSGSTRNSAGATGARRSSGRTMDSFLPAGQPVRRSQPQQTTARPMQHGRMMDMVNPQVELERRRRITEDDDWKAEETFDTEGVAESWGETTEVDWSDLLNAVNQTPEKKTKKSSYADIYSDDPQEDGNSLFDDDEEEEPKKKSRKERKQEKKERKKRKWWKKALAVVAVLVITGGGVLYFWGDSLISRLTNGNSGLISTFFSMVSEEVPFAEDENGRTNVLIFGTEGYDMEGSTGNGRHDGSQLTDSIMVVSFDQKTKDIALLSLPRDLKVPMACMAGKINEVFSCSNQNGTNEEAGALALATQIGDVLGIEFQYWAHVNWASLIDIINTIGGITITLDEDINDRGWTGAVAKAGVPITIDGEQALGFARARHGTTGGDFTRGNTQQKILEGIAQKLLNEGVDWTKALNILNILGDNLRSNFSSDNIKAGVHLLSGLEVAAMRQVPLVDYENNIYYVGTDMINGISYVIPKAGATNYTQIQKYVKKMFNSNPAVREEAVIAVYNAAEVAGLAGSERDRLENEGYSVATVGDAAEEDCMESFCLYALTDSKTATRAALEARYGTTALPAENLPADIVPGAVDFVVVMGRAS